MEPIGILQPISPYNFDLMLALLSRYIHPITDITRAGAYWRVLRIDKMLALLRVDNCGTSEAPKLAVSLVETDGTVNWDTGLAAMAYILGVDTDLSAFYAYARCDSILWQIVAPLVGLRWLRTPSVFEALMTTIIEQQIAWTAAQKAQRWLVEWGGNQITWNGVDFYAFPTPEQIAAATIPAFIPLKITFKRMNVMIDIAKQVATGLFDVERLRYCPMEEAYQELVSLKGIGHWTAIWTLQRARGGHNYVGYNDVALQAAVNHYFYGGTGRIPAEKVAETFERFGEYAGIAANYTIMRWVLDRYVANGT